MPMENDSPEVIRRWERFYILARVFCRRPDCKGILNFGTPDPLSIDPIGALLSLGCDCPDCGTHHRLFVEPSVMTEEEARLHVAQLKGHGGTP